MTAVDCFNGAKQRTGKPLDEGDATGNPPDEDLLVVNPTVDGRLKDEAQD